MHTDAASATDVVCAADATGATNAQETTDAAKTKEPPLYPPQVEALEAIQEWYDQPYHTVEQDATPACDSPALLSMPCGM
eukprot:904656-Pleurochrysis_carterae.AAC.1